QPLCYHARMHMMAYEPVFKTLFESSPDAIFIEDASGRVLDCNPAAAALHGMPRDQIVGRHAADLVPQEHRSRTMTLIGECPRASGRPSLTSDGRSIPVSIRTSRIEYHGQPALL